jgi:succinoglycan biosynthesis transport protein ExoP
LTFNDLLRVFWRRKLLIVVVTAAVVIPSYIGTKLVSPQYESTATLALQPHGTNSNDAFLLSTLDQIVPVYADSATASSTLRRAQGIIGRPLASISVQTFKGTGILKIQARSTHPRLAQLSAAAVARALVDRTQAKTNAIGIRGLDLILLSAPELPTVQVFPRTKLTILVALLLGLALGAAAAVLRESLTTKIESAEDLARVAGVPVFAELPAETAVLKMHSGEDLAEHPRLRIVAEAMRDLRTNLLFTDDSIRSISITSPDGSHGKTTVAFAFAATLARSGTRTILVDADLRRGRVAEMLEVERSPGLMDVLLDETPLESAIRHAPDGLDVLPSGRRSADPGELLTSEFPAVLAQLEREYEAVIVDSTPVIPISDARIVARHTDATLLVARAGFALRRQVRQAVERLGLISVKPTAAILNYSDAVRRSSYYVRPTSEEDEAAKEREARTRSRSLPETRDAARR